MPHRVAFILLASLLVAGHAAAATSQGSDASLSRLRSSVGEIVILVYGTGTKERVRLEDVSETEVVVMPLTVVRTPNSTRTVARQPRRLPAADVALVLSEDGRDLLFPGGTAGARLALVAGKDGYLWVTTTDGAVHQGTLERLTVNAVWLEEGGAPLEYQIGDIRRVEARDRVRDGVLWGLLIGAGSGVLSVGILSTWGDNDASNCACDLWAALGGMAGAGIGSMAGGVVDAIRGRKLLYEAPTTKGATVSVVPMLTMRSSGLMMRLAW